MSERLTRRLAALESKADPGRRMPVLLFGDEPVPDGCDERAILRFSWLTPDEARARGWR